MAGQKIQLTGDTLLTKISHGQVNGFGTTYRLLTTNRSNVSNKRQKLTLDKLKKVMADPSHF